MNRADWFVRSFGGPLLAFLIGLLLVVLADRLAPHLLESGRMVHRNMTVGEVRTALVVVGLALAVFAGLAILLTGGIALLDW